MGGIGDYVMGFDLRPRFGAKALIVGIICGIAGVLVDIDHIPLYIFNMRIGPVFLIPGFFDGPRFAGVGRSLHALVLYLSLATSTVIAGLLLQYSIRSTVKATAKSAVRFIQKAVGRAPAAE
ncbi:hypothetical protein [Methanocella arvoryzae]|uniref:hypothetical protein n=1 Tax=Methanocella arvoryzae TaxID=1175445 RepID=UPI00064F4DF5|nr:hypothetical protein [Methanocella arvoryzae]